MPLDPVTLKSDLEAFFAAPPPTRLECGEAWAAAMSAYAASVVPPSTTVEAAAASLATALAAAFENPAAASLVDAAFTLFATSVAVGMAPTFTGAPPPSPLGIAALLASSAPTHAAGALAFASLIDSWFKTGTATLVAPPFTVVPWS